LEGITNDNYPPNEFEVYAKFEYLTKDEEIEYVWLFIGSADARDSVA